VQAGAGGQGKASDDELEEEKDIVHCPGPKGDSYTAMVVKQHSLERCGTKKPGTILTWVRFHDAARDLFPQSIFSADSLTAFVHPSVQWHA